MRVRLSDGTNEVEIEAHGWRRPTLRQMEVTARRLLGRLRSPIPSEPTGNSTPFGFARDLDGVTLDSSTERAEPYDDGRDQGDEDDDA